MAHGLVPPPSAAPASLDALTITSRLIAMCCWVMLLGILDAIGLLYVMCAYYGMSVILRPVLKPMIDEACTFLYAPSMSSSATHVVVSPNIRAPSSPSPLPPTNPVPLPDPMPQSVANPASARSNTNTNTDKDQEIAELRQLVRELCDVQKKWNHASVVCV